MGDSLFKSGHKMAYRQEDDWQKAKEFSGPVQKCDHVKPASPICECVMVLDHRMVSAIQSEAADPRTRSTVAKLCSFWRPCSANALWLELLEQAALLAWSDTVSVVSRSRLKWQVTVRGFHRSWDLRTAQK
jgi:hypothetical protein